MNKEILLNTDQFDVIRKDNKVGIEPSKLTIVIMPYTTDPRGLPMSIGILREFNPFRDGNMSKTLITGVSEDEDPDILGTAQRQLKFESGFDVQDPDRWSFLGFLTTSKNNSGSHPCFACDVTGLEPETPKSDTEKSTFSLVPVKDALDTDDCFVPAIFMKVFRYIFGFASGETEEKTPQDETKLPDELKKKVLAIDGVNGVGNGIDGAVVMVIKLTPEIEKAVGSIMNSVPFKFEEVGEIKAQ